jgi:signal-transduction protein with cAMP-binding, CBS, and nucleotidyltransferase domain
MLIDLIEKHDLFQSRTKEELAELNRICSMVHFNKNETVFEIDALPQYLFFVVSGCVKLQFPDKTYLEVEPGEMIGEIGLLNGNFRLGNLTATKDSVLIRMSGKELFDPDIIPPSLALSVLRKMGEIVTNFLRSSQQISSKEIVESGESGTVEFKSSLRWNFRTLKKDKVLESVIIKTIAGFLNSKGGHLFIGVNDDGEIVGLDWDGFENDDKLLLHLANLIKQRLSPIQLNFISMTIEHLDDKKFLRVDCYKSNIPAYVVEGNNEFFYIRTGPSTSAVGLSEVYNYIQENFRNQ